MKNKILTLILVLVMAISNIVPALAMSNMYTSINTANNSASHGLSYQSTTKPVYYRCIESSWQCIVTNTKTSTTYDSVKACYDECRPKTTTTIRYDARYDMYPISNTTTKPTYTTSNNMYNDFSLRYTTTTTRPSYTYTTVPSYTTIPRYVTTTTKQNYTTSNNMYSNFVLQQTTTTTRPVVFFNTNNYQLNNFVNTTTKPIYTHTTIPSYTTTPRYVVPTTKPSYVINFDNQYVERRINTAIPTTTLPVNMLNPMNQFDAVYKYTPTTTKPLAWVTDQSIIKSIDLTKAIPITARPLFTAEVENQELIFKPTTLLVSLQASLLSIANLMKQEDEIKPQVVTVGDEEKLTSTGEKYLIVVVPNMDKDLFKKYIEERQSKYDIKIVSLQENGVKNNPDEVLAFIQNVYKDFPYTYLVFHEKIKISEDKAIWSSGYTVPFPSYAPYWNWTENISFGIIKTEWLNKNNQGWVMLNNIEPSLFLTHQYGNRYTTGICCDTGLPTYEGLIYAFRRNPKTKFFFENRGTYPVSNQISNFEPLNAANFAQRFPNSNFVYANSATEPINTWVKDYKWLYTFYSEPHTLIWNDKDGNEHVDNNNSEIRAEKYWTNINDGIKRMVFVIGCNNFNAQDYVSFVSQNKENEEIHLGIPSSLATAVVNEVNSGMSLGRAYRNSYNAAIASAPKDDALIIKARSGFFNIYGPPEATLKDLLEEPAVNIQPKTDEIRENNVIEIPKGKFETDFIIRNIGKVDVNYSFSRSEEIGITPRNGRILASQEQKINLKVLNSKSIDLQSNEDINTTLKLRITKIYFKSNAGDKEITIKYWGI